MLGNVPRGKLAAAVLDVLRAYGRDGHWLTVAEVAESAMMSVRTFQRRLSEEDRVMSGLVDQVRFELATEMLNDANVGGAEIAERLGYRHQGDFCRAWKRWTGISPDEFRHHPCDIRQIKPHFTIPDVDRRHRRDYP